MGEEGRDHWVFPRSPTVSLRQSSSDTLSRLVEPCFHPDSYGYRPGKSALDAVGVARRRCWRYAWVLDLDIQSFFDRIDSDLLMRAVRKHTDCPWVLLYIERWLIAPVQMADGSLIASERGAPQGGVMAPRTQKITLSAGQGSVRTDGRRAVDWSHGQGDAVPDDNLVIADEDFLDEKAHETLSFRYVEGARRRPQSREERGQRFSEAQVGCTVD